MKVYVAGASKEIERCEATIQKLRHLGYEITFDWTAVIRKVGNANPLQDPETCAKAAMDDYLGVKGADAVLLLVPDPSRSMSVGTGKGMWIEMGIAIAEGIAIFIAGESGSIFAYLPDIHRFETENDAIYALGKYRDRFGILEPVSE